LIFFQSGSLSLITYCGMCFHRLPVFPFPRVFCETFRAVFNSMTQVVYFILISKATCYLIYSLAFVLQVIEKWWRQATVQRCLTVQSSFWESTGSQLL
jgi:hypothetical protein